MFDVTIVIPTCGDQHWSDLAMQRAMPSAWVQGVPVLHEHCVIEGLAFARNHILRKVETEWVIYLDADDELEPGYVDAMAMAVDQADLRGPAVRYVRNGAPRHPYVPRVAGHEHNCVADCLAFGNWLVVGTAVRVDMIRKVGGWRDWPAYEDWCLWARCWQAGATVEPVPTAVYRAHVRPNSRNRVGSQLDRNEVHRSIARDLGLPVPA